MATWSTQNRNSSSFSNQSKNTSVFTNQSKNSYWSDFLLMESGFYLLLESGDKIALEQSGVVYYPSYTNQSKS